MLDHYYAVIMAGGGGTRLWPLSRKDRPKQMLQLFGDVSLFQTSVKRLHKVFPPDNIFVVTVEEQSKELQDQCPEIPFENFLLEPLPRGTASVVGLAAIALKHKDPQAVMAVLTADHMIRDEEIFIRLLSAAYDASLDGYMVTLGIAPTHPATGYGYIQQGKHIGSYKDQDLFAVSRFKEKPTHDKAVQMLSEGFHVWNSGMFVWQVNRILDEFARQMPNLWATLQRIENSWGHPDQNKVINQIWPDIHPQTIDYGIMENATGVAVIPATGLGWNDVGSWDSLFDVLPCDKNGNIVMGDGHVLMDTHDSLIYQKQDRRLLVTIGVDDLVIVDTDDVVLVCHKEQAQKVRQVVNQLKEISQRDFI